MTKGKGKTMGNAQARVTNAAQNPLCGRLQQKFSGRGAASASVSYQTRAIPRVDPRIASGGRKIAKAVNVNPFEETAEFVPAGKTVKKQASNVYKAAAKAKTEQTQKTQAYAKTTPFASGAYAAAYARAASIRAQAAAVDTKKTVPAAPGSAVEKQGLLQLIRGGRADEVRVKSSPIPKSIVIAVILFTAIVMMILFSFSQINEFKREISGLESQRSELNTEISQLAIQLDLKNDVRVIEQTAREDIGMVRRNQVESKYINVAQGDRVEVLDDAQDNEEDFGIFTTLLSSFGSSWDKLMEYID